MRLVDDAVDHEFVHLVHRDDAKPFWERLGQTMPDYDRRKEELLGWSGESDYTASPWWLAPSRHRRMTG